MPDDKDPAPSHELLQKHKISIVTGSSPPQEDSKNGPDTPNQTDRRIASRSPVMADIEDSVTSLLQSTKKLLRSLTAWSVGNMTTDHVIEVYQLLITHFQETVKSFEAAHLQMSDLAHIPDELYQCLQEALVHPPSTAVLEEHMPRIRDTILQLLQALREKQARLRDPPPETPSRRVSTATTTTTARSVASSPNASPRTTITSTRTSSSIPYHQQPLSLDARNQRESLPVRPQFAVDRASDADASSSAGMVLFLQVGNRIRKVHSHPPRTLANLRDLFVSHFSSVADNVPINIQEPESKIFYELENIAEVVPYSLLSLPPKNEAHHELPCEQVTKSLEALRNEVRQWMVVSKADPLSMIETIRKQQTEIKQLRQDLNALGQMADQFREEMQQTIKQARTEIKLRLANNSSEPTKSLPQTRRQYVQETKEQSEAAAMRITHQLQELQDTVDDLKLDVTQRRCQPSSVQLDYCDQEVKALATAIGEMDELIKSAKPIWKSTWEFELQTVVKEQQFLKEQEALLSDIREDHADLVQVLQQLRKVAEIQRAQQRTIEQQQPPRRPLLLAANDGACMESVLKELEALEVDHEKRVRALQLAEKMRARELANRVNNDFQKELAKFVQERRLRQTGGIQEADRKREERERNLLKEIFQK